jgi:hypothetical protein
VRAEVALARRFGIAALAVVLGCGGPESDAGALLDPPAPAYGPSGEPEGARLVVLLRAGQSRADLERAVRARYGPAARSEALFADPALPEEMRRMFVVEAPTRPGGLGAWDDAYGLRALGGFERVEPDRSDTLVPETRDAFAEATCFARPGVPAPADPAWSLERIHAPQAWSLPPMTGGAARGRGVRICHPDTGWAEHAELDRSRLDLARAANILDGGRDARDPLDYFFPLASRGHGTATGSVLMSGFGGRLTGVAPEATLVPIRTVRSVVQAFDSDVARAVQHATRVGCEVVSMSLGGRAFFGLEAAVAHAAASGLVVVAAAGNCVPFVVAPALYDHTIAVAATNSEDLLWHGSSHGPAVDLCAPGEDVYRAVRARPEDAQDSIAPSDGTSFATAEVAGAAALWLAHHDRVAVEQAGRARGESVHETFLRLATATAATPPGWDRDEGGAGVLDVEALLRAPLDLPSPRLRPAPARDDVELLARQIGRDPTELRRRLAGLLVASPDPSAFAPELQDLALRDPDVVRSLLAREAGALEPAAEASLEAGASEALLRALGRSQAPGTTAAPDRHSNVE